MGEVFSMVCKLNNGETVIINSIEDMKDYIDEDLYNFIENTDVCSLKECIEEIKESLNYMKNNINNCKKLNKEKLIKEINNVLTEINYYNN
jgi:predicted RecB family endonuclease